MLQPFATKLLNATFYEVGWLCCVLGASWGYPVTGGLLALALVGLHLWLASSRQSEILLILSSCLLGVMVDSSQQALGLFTFKTDSSWPLWLPLWVFVIWAQFATLFHYALYWLKGRYLVAALFGLIGGPLAYWGGIRLGAASFGENPTVTIIVLALVWAAIIPALVRLSVIFGDQEGAYMWRRSG
ncbi:MAG: DUF2878 domain-containing protein [Desulfuromonadales bacterium]